MNNSSKRRIASLILAGAILSGAPMAAHAENAKEGAIVSSTIEDDVINYTIQEGDTLAKICFKFYGDNSCYEQLADYNHMKITDIIYAGDTLLVPRVLQTGIANDPVRNVDEDEVYKVRSGDMLVNIVGRFYGAQQNLCLVNKLATYNDLYDPNILEVDQELLIPSREKLDKVVPYDYTEQYAALQWRLEHPEECHPFYWWDGECYWLWPNYQPDFKPDYQPDFKPDYKPDFKPDCKPDCYPGPYFLKP
ncbi:MAG: LysM peptidoglycan-binding domain-containing protein [Bacilli bacterium]|nr:LysM peptidoglycan-binding domain-containing protein [Bacilli bacterium]